MNIKSLKKRIISTLIREEVQKAAVFGSVARGDQKKNSDVDLIVKMKTGKSLFDLSGLKIDLEEKLGKKVDIITYASVNPLLRERIMQEQKVIYEKRS